MKLLDSPLPDYEVADKKYRRPDKKIVMEYEKDGTIVDSAFTHEMETDRTNRLSQ